MGLPAYAADPQAPSERLHYFHPFRIAVATLIVMGAYLGLVYWIGGYLPTMEARGGLLVAALLFAVGRTFQPRTLSADGTQVRWKKLFQPAQRVSRHDVAGIQYLPTAGPGSPRYYLVNRDGQAILWVDRFTPAQMWSFASYLGIPMQSVAVAPSKNASAEAAADRSAVLGQRRSFMVWMAVCAVIGLALTIGSAVWVVISRAELAAYERAPRCEQASANPLSCRFDAPAVVTGFSAKGHIDITFFADVPTFHHRTTYVRLAGGAALQPPLAVGETVQIEVFDGNLLAINGVPTDSFTTLHSNASWLLVPAAGVFLLIPLVSIVVGWKGPDSWFVGRPRPNPPAKSISSEGSLRHRLWLVLVG